MMIRPAILDDLPAITEIYNEAIRNTVSTMDTVEKKVAERREWFDYHGDQYPLLVCEEQETVAGWASLNLWSDRIAYALTAEVSVFIHTEHRGKGIGKRLVKEIITAGKTAQRHLLVARISTENEISLNMFRRAGFTDLGIMKESGRKFDRWIDIVVLQFLYK
jgi:phosphinothricin acetyltransferase